MIRLVLIHSMLHRILCPILYVLQARGIIADYHLTSTTNLHPWFDVWSDPPEEPSRALQVKWGMSHLVVDLKS